MLEQLVLPCRPLDDLVDEEHRDDERYAHGKRNQQILGLSAPDDECDCTDEQVHQTGAEIGLSHDAGKRYEHEPDCLEILAQVIEMPLVARHNRGIEQDHRDLRKLARLQLR